MGTEDNDHDVPADDVPVGAFYCCCGLGQNKCRMESCCCGIACPKSHQRESSSHIFLSEETGGKKAVGICGKNREGLFVPPLSMGLPFVQSAICSDQLAQADPWMFTQKWVLQQGP